MMGQTAPNGNSGGEAGTSVVGAAPSERSAARGFAPCARAFAVAAVIFAATFVPTLTASPAQAREVVADPADLSPVAATLMRVQPSARGTVVATSTPTPDISTPDKFIAAVARVAQDSQRDSGVPASVTIAQAILESEWGRSGLSTKAQNYFGIKALDGPGPAGEISMDTWEVFSGRSSVVDDAFKAYHSLAESVMDHGRFLKDNPRYAAAFKTTNPEDFIYQIHLAGYATDPAYCDKLDALIVRYDLARYDLRTTG